VSAADFVVVESRSVLEELGSGHTSRVASLADVRKKGTQRPRREAAAGMVARRARGQRWGESELVVGGVQVDVHVKALVGGTTGRR
jgi:hypothetical protein